MRTTPYTITDLLKQIRLNLYVIPQFQRDFIWNEGQVKLLIDSIARNYPLGSLLTMTKSADINLQSRTITATIEFEEDNEQESVEEREDRIGTQYVLDGQQRLTSIARVFLNGHPKKNYYFDLKLMYDEFDSDEQDKNWIVVRKRGKDDPERKGNGRLLRTDVALDPGKTDVLVKQMCT